MFSQKKAAKAAFLFISHFLFLFANVAGVAKKKNRNTELIKTTNKNITICFAVSHART